MAADKLPKIKQADTPKGAGGNVVMAEVKEKRLKKEKEDKSSKKSKKSKKPKANSESSLPTAADTETEPEPNPTDDKKSKKRKRTTTTEEELEIDITAPEPPSKKALRKLKKHPELAEKAARKAAKAAKKLLASSSTTEKKDLPVGASQNRSKYGIWIGNLSFSTTPQILESHLVGDGKVTKKEDITRVNMPVDKMGKNRGFAYVDFTSNEALEHALGLSETLLGGRRVLIKNSKDFSKRPAASTTESGLKTGANLSKNPPSRILYVGNLDFNVTREDLEQHFSFAGKIVHVRLATFEDTGKCKGFGFVDFEDQDSVRRAMLGLTPEEEEVHEGLDGKEEVEMMKKRRKRAIVGMRPISMEYGQDPTTRYKKRFGGNREIGDEDKDPRQDRKRDNGAGRRNEAEKRPRRVVDNRSTDAGAVYSTDVKRTGAIAASTGKKIAFDD